ncbi:uncharacterized protein [Branchiostoma lanceolatum]|uniref:uncharacterized protein n=1 Tax=Branchiostoma lanceolatum TaxID=7740 RepID=UPI0034524341
MSDPSERQGLLNDDKTDPKVTAGTDPDAITVISHQESSDDHSNADGCCFCPLAKSWCHRLFSRESADPERLGPVGDEHGEHPMQNYLSRFVSIICLFCLVTTGIVISVGNMNSTGDNMDVEFTVRTPNITPPPTGHPHMELIGPEKLERFLYIAMIAGLLWMIATLVCPKLLIVQTTNQHGCSEQLDKSVLHLLGATLIFAVGAAFLPLINFVAFLSNAECYRIIKPNGYFIKSAISCSFSYSRFFFSSMFSMVLS